MGGKTFLSLSLCSQRCGRTGDRVTRLGVRCGNVRETMW